MLTRARYRLGVRRLALVLATVAIVAAGCSSDDGKGDGDATPSPGPTGDEIAGFELTSPAFAADAEIPDGFTCDGANASPPLQWTGVPDGTAELALTMIDPDAGNGHFVHWVAWGIDPATGELPEQSIPPEVVQGTNNTGQAVYLGPCPPPGDPHHYEFMLYALSEPLALAAGASEAELVAALEGNVLARAELVGLYQRA
jgi:hypothetical protein